MSFAKLPHDLKAGAFHHLKEPPFNVPKDS